MHMPQIQTPEKPENILLILEQRAITRPLCGLYATEKRNKERNWTILGHVTN